MIANSDSKPQGKQSRRPQIPGLRVFATNSHPITSVGRQISFSSLVSAAAMSSAKTIDEAPPTPKQDLQFLPSWCRKLEKDPGVRANAGDPNPLSDAVLFEEAMIWHFNLRYHTAIPSPEDHLITLMYYNVFRGLTSNIRALKLHIPSMLTGQYDSPFVTGGLEISSLSPDLRPTRLQQTISHHPSYDIFPCSVLRDNAIEYWHVQQNPQESRLCMALAGRQTWHEVDLGSRIGCILWGEPDVVESWEVSEGFAKRWPFLVKGAVRLEAATNVYRRLRDETPIFFA
jgi:hypothetical protein